MVTTYELASRWHVDASRDRLWQALEEGLAGPDPMPWWPQVRTIGRGPHEVVLRTHSHLGYALTFRLYDLVTSRPERMTFAADGDLRGSGSLVFREVDAVSSVLDIRWDVDVDRRWMRLTAPLLRRVFVAAHVRVMADGERHLNTWIADH